MQSKKKTVHEETFEVVHKNMGSEIPENSKIALKRQSNFPVQVSIKNSVRFTKENQQNLSGKREIRTKINTNLSAKNKW